MAEKELNPGLRLALDLGPVGVYFAAYYWFKDAPLSFAGQAYSGIVVATAVFVPVMLAALGLTWALTRSLPRMAVFTAIIVVEYGGLPVWLNDETFTKMRPTVVYSMFAAILGFGLWAQGRSYLAYLMGALVPLTAEGWRIFTRNCVCFFGFMALFNEFVWRVLGEEAWVWLDTFGQLILTFLFLATQYPVLQRHSSEDE